MIQGIESINDKYIVYGLSRYLFLFLSGVGASITDRFETCPPARGGRLGTELARVCGYI